MPSNKIFVLTLLLSICKAQNINSEYVVNTDKCKIPDINPFSEEVTLIIKPENYTSCNNSELLTHVSKINNFAILEIKEDLIPRYANLSKNINCCYSNISRNGSLEYPDVGINISSCQPFQKKVILKHDNVMVRCEWNGTVVYENVHNSILLKNPIEEKINNTQTKGISVLLVVVDSVSRLNFIRTMEQTYKFLLQNDFIEMKGYNKIDDNTFPNFMALLTGFNSQRSYKICNPRKINKLDNCPMIWYDYRNLGYVTAYAEDHAVLNTFNYFSKGFTRPPTDYYFKPYVEAAERLTIVMKDAMPYCTGPETSGERILNLAKDFAKTFIDHPSFGVFWMNTFSHNYINSPYGMDAKMKQFFSDIKNAGVFNESIVVFLSDHGIRFGDIRVTRSGWFEERMPINMISVPMKFRKRFRKEYQNLKENSNKLTNTYDMFMTLQHILKLSGLDYKIKPSSACPKCVSLFQKISSNRSCQDASIPLEWCTCIGHLRAIESDNEYVKNATEVTVNIIKKILDSQAKGKCSHYTPSRILSSSMSEPVPYKRSKYLYVTFETEPAAVFLVTVKFKKFVSNYSDFQIVRYDNFYPNSECVNATKELRKYCTCLEL